jgi:hypoxanthine phosphoribosyltransferase
MLCSRPLLGQNKLSAGMVPGWGKQNDLTSSSMAAIAANLKPVISAEQIQKRVREMGRQISNDYRGKTAHLLAVLENGFMFTADLVRAMDVPVICEFIKPLYRDRIQGTTTSKEIFFSPEIDVRGHHVLLLEGLVHSGVTTDFLINGLRSRGAASVRLATLLDRQAARRVALQPDYFGFLVDDKFLVGYGLGNPLLERNLPYLAATQP